MVLSDLGARVDKIEDPSGGDYLRAMPPLTGGMNAAFHALNRNKRSCVLDLKTEAGRTALLRLVRHYDVLVESFRPGTLARLGLAPEALRRENPALIVCSLSGYGQDGPLANRAGHDLLYLARAGVLGVTGPTGGAPQVPALQAADTSGGLYAVAGILAALVARAASGQGAFLDLSLTESAMSVATLGLLTGVAPDSIRGGELLSGGVAAYQTYRTRDDRFVALAALEPKFWFAFCEGVGLTPDLRALVPGPHQAEWKETLSRIFASKTRHEWAVFARDRDACVEPVLAPEELSEDAQHRARKVFFEIPGVSWKQPRSPLVRSDDIAPAPAHGMHTSDVLADAGFSASEIAALGGQSSASSAR